MSERPIGDGSQGVMGFTNEEWESKASWLPDEAWVSALVETGPTIVDTITGQRRPWPASLALPRAGDAISLGGVRRKILDVVWLPFATPPTVEIEVG